MINRPCLAAMLLAAAALTGLTPSVARAQLAGLGVTGDTLYIIGEDKNGLKLVDTVKIKVKSSDKILAIDVRASDGALYGVSAQSNVYKINPKNGKVEKLFSLGAKLKGAISMDCNPVADACRLVSDKGLNARFTFTAQTLLFDADLSYATGTKKPRIIAIGYTNAFAGATSTELFDIDAETDKVYEQDPPNSGVLNVIAKARPKVEKPLAFDIVAYSEGQNYGVVIYKKEFYQFDFSVGELSKPHKIRGLKANIGDVVFLKTVP